MGGHTHDRSSQRGLTLVEIMVVVALVGLLSAAVVGATHQTASAKLNRAGAMITPAVKTAYARSSATSRHMRVVFDFEKNLVWLEEADQPMFVQSKDITGAAGADPSTAIESRAAEEAARFARGTPVVKPKFKPIKSLGFDTEGEGGKTLGGGIRFKEIQTSHDDEARRQGRAYLYFWPGGQTERASIQLQTGNDKDPGTILTVVVSPLTGKSVIRRGAVSLPKVETDRDLSDREDTGF